MDERTPEQKAHDEKRWQWILTGRQAAIIMDALGIYSSDRNDAPHAEISELRDRLVRMGAIRR